MNCQFCPDVEVGFNGFDGKCPQCHTKHSISHTYDHLWYYGFSVKYKNSYYYFDFYLPDHETKEGAQFYLSKGVNIAFLVLDHFPNLTPFNALQKLPTLLTFQ
jgi:hypothetical protein